MMKQSFIDHAAAVDWIENELCNLNITISLTSKYHSHLLCLMDSRGSVGPLYSGSTGVEWRIVPVGRSCAIYQTKHVTMMSLLNLIIASSRGGRLAQHFWKCRCHPTLNPTNLPLRRPAHAVSVSQPSHQGKGLDSCRSQILGIIFIHQDIPHLEHSKNGLQYYYCLQQSHAWRASVSIS